MESNLLYPNLMSREDLIKTLKERYLQLPNLDKMETAELIRIYSKFVLPLGRRNDDKVKQHSNDIHMNDLSSSQNAADECFLNSSICRLSLKRNATIPQTNSDFQNKMIKLHDDGNMETKFKNQHKRLNNCDHEDEIDLDIEEDSNSLEKNLVQCQQKLKRQKISWV